MITWYGEKIAKDVFEEDIYIDFSKLKKTDLYGLPKHIKGSLICEYCDNLETLYGAPEIIEGDCLFLDNNKVKYLKYAPKYVEGLMTFDNFRGISSFKYSTIIKVGEFEFINGNLRDLKGLPQISIGLNLENNKIETLKDLKADIFISDKIEYLHLSQNQIEELYLDESFDNKTIELLTATDNKITKFRLPKNILKVYLFKNNISGKQVIESKSLTFLNLDKNNITEIDVSQSTQLTKLSIAHNNLKKISLPNQILSLCIDYNNITEIDVENTNLIEFNANKNGLKSVKLPKEMSKVVCIDNELENFEGFPLIAKYIDVSKNKITSLKGCPEIVETLMIRSNYLKDLNHFPKVCETFYAVNNQIEEVTIEKNPYKQRVKWLYLNENKIKKVKIDFDIEELDISDNYIESFEGFPKNMKILNINNNPLKSLNGIPNIKERLHMLFDTEFCMKNNYCYLHLFEGDNLHKLLLLENILKIEIYLNMDTKEKIQNLLNKNHLILGLASHLRANLLQF